MVSSLQSIALQEVWIKKIQEMRNKRIKFFCIANCEDFSEDIIKAILKAKAAFLKHENSIAVITMPVIHKV